MAKEAIDNLGRSVNAANMSIAELKGLVASLMKSKVGPAKPVSETKDDPAKKLVSLFEKYTKDFEDEVKEQKKILEKIADGIKEMKSKKNKPAGKEEKQSFSDKVSKSLSSGLKANKEEQTTAKSVRSLEQIFGKKGSGYTHDIYCEKVLKEIYSVLSKIATSKGITDVKSVDDLAKDIKPPDKEKTPKNRDISDLVDALESGGIEVDLDELESRFSSISEFPSLLKQGIKPWDEITTSAETFSDLVVGSEKRRFEEWVAHYATQADIIAAQAAMGIEIDNKQAAAIQKASRNRLRNIQEQKKEWNEVVKTVEYLENKLLGFKIFETIIKGVVDEERKFTQDVRQAAYEIAGATKESKALQRSFEDIGKTAKITGFDRTEYQKQYLTILKQGVKDQKKAMSLTTTQLNTEKQIGVEAGSLGDTFVKLNNELKFTEDQTADVGRGIREVGRNTGLVGKELAEVVSSSQKFVDQMKKAGTATASSVKNVIGLQAEFKKLGITEAGDKLLSALSSTTGFYEAGIETQSLLANAASRVGLTFEMTTGGIAKSNEKLKTLNKGLVQTANSFGLGGSNVEEMRASFDSLSEEAKRAMNLRFKAAFGMEAGEVLGTIEAIENKTKTLSEKLSDLNKEKAKNLTLEERTALAEKERSLKLTAGLGALTALSEAAKDVTNMDQALAKFGKRRSEFEGDIKALGGAWTSETDAARTAIESSVNALNEGLKKAGKKGLAIDSAKIEKALRDPAALRELTSEITKGEQELATAQKAQADPLTSMDQSLKEINDGIRNMSQGIISGIFNSPLGRILIGILAFLSASIAAYSMLQTGITSIVNVFESLKRVVGLGTTTAGGSGPKKMLDDLYQFFKGKTPEAATDAVEQEMLVTQKATKIATEKTVDIFNQMLLVLKDIKACICGQTTSIKEGLTASGKIPVDAPALKKTPEEIAALKAAGRARKEEEKARGVDSATAKAVRRNEQKNAKIEAALNKAKKKELLQETKNNKKTSKILKSEEQSVNMPESPETEGFDINKIISSGKDMAKSAAAIAVLGLGAIALGAAVVWLGKGILSAFNLDMKTIAEVAGAVAALAVAAGTILGAGYVAYEQLTQKKEAQEGTEMAPELNADMLKKAGVIMLLGPTLVLLGAAVVKAAQLINQAFGLDMGTVAQIAGDVIAIVGAAGALCAGAAEALEGMDKLKGNKTFKALLRNPAKALYTIGKAALALLLLGPALVLLGSAVVKISQLIMGAFGLDMSTAAKVAGDVAAIIASTAIIALAVVGAMAGLWALGQLASVAWGVAPIMLMGAGALLVLTPAILLLAAGLNLIIRGILGITGIDAGVAAKAAFDVGTLILSSAFIAGAVLAGVAGLMVFSVLWPLVPLIWALMGFGAQALFELTVPVILLAAGLNLFVRSVLGITGIDAGVAAKAAFNVASLIAAAGAIAFSVLAGVVGLTALGSLVPLIPVYAPFMIAGAAGLLILAPAVIALAAALVQITRGAMALLVDPTTAAEVAKSLSSLIESTSSIVGSVLYSMASLAVLGVATASGLLPLAAGLMLLGAAGLMVLTPAVIAISGALIGIAASAMGSVMDPKEATEVAEDLNKILKAASDIAWSIVTMVPMMAVLASMWAVSKIVGALLWFGVWSIQSLMPPVVGFVKAIKDFYDQITFADPKEMVGMGETAAAIFKSVGLVTENILGARDGLLSLVGANSWGWFGTASEGMKQGAEAVKELMSPVRNFIFSIWSFYNSIASVVKPDDAIKMGDGVYRILDAVAKVTNGIIGVKEGLIGLAGMNDWSWFSGDPLKNMEEGKKALYALMEPVKEFILSIVAFYKSLGINPEDAVNMGDGVYKILDAVARVTNGIIGVKEGLIGLDGLNDAGWWSNPMEQMTGGMAALEQLKGPVKQFIGSIYSFYQEVASIMSPAQAEEAGNGVGMILGAVGFVTSRIVCAKEALIALSKSGGWGGVAGVAKQLQGGKEMLEAIKQPILDYAISIKVFSDILSSVFGTPEELENSANGVANVLRGVGFVTWHILASAKMLASIKSSQIASAITNALKIVSEGIMTPIKKSPLNTAELEENLKKLDLVLEIMKKMKEISEISKDVIPVEIDVPMENKVASKTGTSSRTSEATIENGVLKTGKTTQSGDQGAILEDFNDELRDTLLEATDPLAEGWERSDAIKDLMMQMKAGAAQGLIELPKDEKGRVLQDSKSFMQAAEEHLKKSGLQNKPSEGAIRDAEKAGITTSDKSIAERQNASMADSAHDTQRALSEFIETSIRGKGIIVRSANDEAKPNVSTVSTVNPTDPNVIQSRIRKDKVANSPNKSEVTSPELSEIASKTDEQTQILMDMRELFEKFVELAKPSSEIAGTSGGAEAVSSGLPVSQKPTNYYRRVIGNVSSTPGKAIANLGAKSLS